MNEPETSANMDAELTRPDSASVLKGRPTGVIYFVKSWNAIKIGFSTDIKTRLAQLQTGSPFEIELLGFFAGTEQDEVETLGRFSPLRIRGEWFYPHPELIAFINKMKRKKRKLVPPTQRAA